MSYDIVVTSVSFLFQDALSERSNTKLLPPPLLVRRDKHEYAKKHLVTHASGIGHLRIYTFL